MRSLVEIARVGLGILASITAALALAQSVRAPAAIEGPRFAIERYEVSGNTLLPRAAIDAALAPHTGAGKSFPDIQLAVAAIEAAYRSAGYGLVQVRVPEQEIAGGVVRLRVVEAKLGKVAVEGNRFFGADNIRRSLPALVEGRTPDSAALDVQLQMATENPAKQTRLFLRAGDAEDEVLGTVRVADEKPWRIIGSLDNSGSDSTGRYRVGLGLQHANLTDRDDVLNVQALTSPGRIDDVKIFGAGYRLPLYALRSTLDLVAGYSSVDSGTVQGIFTVAGKGTTLGARWSYYLPKLGGYEHKAALGYDWRDYQNTFQAAGVNLLPDYRLHPLSLTYSGLWRTASAELGFHASGVRNLAGGSGGGQATFDAIRPGAPADYVLGRGGFTYMQLLALEAQLRVTISGQYTDDPLLSGEQFGIGGPDSLRGYQSRAIAGDRGYSGQLELYSPNFGPALGVQNIGMRALAFYDWGRVSRLQPQPGVIAVERVSSVGVGLRMGAARGWNLRADYAHIRNAADASGSDLRRRFDVSVVVLF
ncbi:MAG: ShlB/FhaC/HecB family hemolysin secretion/activation protein [Burkholderiales bacterium]|nr:ShlB/FhaC/HecB family hemolysin secretion/activation protein [Burkholderiales bacterium]